MLLQERMAGHTLNSSKSCVLLCIALVIMAPATFYYSNRLKRGIRVYVSPRPPVKPVAPLTSRKTLTIISASSIPPVIKPVACLSTRRPLPSVSASAVLLTTKPVARFSTKKPLPSVTPSAVPTVTKAVAHLVTGKALASSNASAIAPITVHPGQCVSDLCAQPSSCCCVVKVPNDTTLVNPNLNSVPKESEVNKKYLATGIKIGGFWSPKDCADEQSLALILPFRNREENLLVFLDYIHAYLQKQKLSYNIYVVDQIDDKPFNRAALFNVGILEALKDRRYTCFVFHDIDHLPVDQFLSYRCDTQPMHMASRVDKWSWGIPYSTFAGGVIKQRTLQLFEMNGFSNLFWGWGGEDDDVMIRWRQKFKWQRPKGNLGHFATIKSHHSRSRSPDFDRMALLASSAKRMYDDGLNSTCYDLVKKGKAMLYTRLQVILKMDLRFKHLYSRKDWIQ